MCRQHGVRRSRHINIPVWLEVGSPTPQGIDTFLQSASTFNYFRQSGGYAVRLVCLSVCLSVCVSVCLSVYLCAATDKKLCMNLHEIFTRHRSLSSLKVILFWR